MISRHTLLRFAVLALPAALLVGCGGDDEDELADGRRPPAETDGNGGDAGGDDQADGGDTNVRIDEGWGHLVGRVVFEGTPPTLAPLVRQGQENVRDAQHCALHDVPSEYLVVGPGGGVQNAFVYLAELPEGAEIHPDLAEPPADEQFDNNQCRFEPHCMVIRVGQTVPVTNSDPIAHNTHVESTRQPRQFNEQIPQGQDRPLTYTRTERSPVHVKCDIHSWMSAYHLVIDHPYGTVTAADGTFRLENMPAGTYTITVWHEAARGGYLHRDLEVTVVADQETDIGDITFPASAYVPPR